MKNTEVGSYHTAALGRLNAARADHARVSEAERRITEAATRLTDEREQTAALRRFHASEQAETSVHTCPIDVAALRAFALTAAADERPVDKHGKPYDGTYRQLVTWFLAKVERADAPIGHVTIRYRHSRLGAALVDAGIVVASRQYARPEDWGKDPFTLPKKLRGIALARFGFDFDDRAAHPHAQQQCVRQQQAQSETQKFLRHRDTIFTRCGEILFPQLGVEDRAKQIKAAFAGFSMDSSWKDFLRRAFKPVQICPRPEAVRFALPQGEHFDMGEYLSAQQKGTDWLARRMEAQTGMLTFISDWLKEYKPPPDEIERRRAIMRAAQLQGQPIAPADVRPHRQRKPERTLKSYVFQDLESVSRDAKCAWCAAHGHAVLSQQHDGIVVSLRDGTPMAAARDAMQAASEAALGYPQPCTCKEMELPTGCAHVQTREETEASAPTIGQRAKEPAAPPPQKHKLSEGFAETRPHEHVEWQVTSEPRAFKRGQLHRGKTYDLVRMRALQEDPVLRLFLRLQSLERGGHVNTATGRLVQLTKRERDLLANGDMSVHMSGRTLRTVAALHAAHMFTHAAACDGSKAGAKSESGEAEETDANAEDRLARAAYGIWTGVAQYGMHEAGADYVRATDKGDCVAVGRGLTGGRLPDSFEACDCELYAAYKYLLRVWEEAGSVEKRQQARVLIMSDCKPAMQQMEQAWRKGEAHGLRKWDRGALLEAICSLRADLGRVVCVWTPAHAGISPNAMADLAAGAHTGCKDVEDVTEHLAPHVHARPCVYERMVRRVGESAACWEVADRKPYAEARKRARAYVRQKLGETTAPGSTTAGVTGPLWSEVVKGTDRKCRPEIAAKAAATKGGKPPPVQPEDVAAYNVRTSVVLGMRADNICGVSHGKLWQKQRRAEGDKGGPATNSEAFGCWACKRARDAKRRAAAAAQRPRRRTAASAANEWQEERDEQRSSLATTRHIECGECEATRGVWQGKESNGYVYALQQAHGTCREQRDEKGRGAGVQATAMIGGALSAARAVQRGEKLSDAQWANRFAVLAACLPAWAEVDESEGGPVEICTAAVLAGQGKASEAVTAWKEAAEPGIAFERQRRTAAGLMQLVVRLWRERVELDAPGISTDEKRWVVRRPQKGRVRRRNVTAGSSQLSKEVKFALKQKADMGEVAANFSWSPWKSHSKPASGDAPASNERESEASTAATKNWKLRDKCLRVASYYRVLHSGARAGERVRREVTLARFRRWASTWLEQRKAQAADAAEQAQQQRAEVDERQRRGGQPSAATRMERKRADIYRNGVRHYKPRAAQHVINRRLIMRRGRRVDIVAGAEIGPRLYENIKLIAERCEQERRRRGDG